MKMLMLMLNDAFHTAIGVHDSNSLVAAADAADATVNAAATDATAVAAALGHLKRPLPRTRTCQPP